MLTDDPDIEVSYNYNRSIPLPRGGFRTELFSRGSVPADRDRTVSAFVTYAEAGGDEQEGIPDNQQEGAPDDQQTPPDDADAEAGTPGLPATGGGGSAP